VRLQIGINAPRTSGPVLKARAGVPALVTAVSILFSPATAVAEEIDGQTIRARAFEEAISASIRASAARELAAARAQADRELRGLPARFRWHGWAEVDVLALCGAAELDFHQVIGAMDNRRDASAVPDAGGS
jgi:hypothetical protein